MNNGPPERVIGENRCPKCNGTRIVQIIDRRSAAMAKADMSQVLWGPDEEMYHWCSFCGGEGTAGAALERVLIK